MQLDPTACGGAGATLQADEFRDELQPDFARISLDLRAIGE
jgi:hypothetical protein